MALPPPRKPKKQQNKDTAPGYMVTLADMFMLLLTFFILILSFSSLEQERYRAAVASMAMAFNFAPAEMTEHGLADPEDDTPPVSPDAPIPMPGAPAGTVDSPELVQQDAQDQPDIHPGVEQLAAVLISELEEAVIDENVDVTYDQRRVVIRFAEDATFPTGSAELRDRVLPLIEEVVDVLAACEGDITVEGHSDNRPIVSAQYRSNWDLSSARAVSVVHELIRDLRIPAERVVAAGRAETIPIDTNETAAGRARNRRVEINIYEPDCEGGLPGMPGTP